MKVLEVEQSVGSNQEAEWRWHVQHPSIKFEFNLVSSQFLLPRLAHLALIVPYLSIKRFVDLLDAVFDDAKDRYQVANAKDNHIEVVKATTGKGWVEEVGCVEHQIRSQNKCAANHPQIQDQSASKDAFENRIVLQFLHLIHLLD